jgi:uncharacterized protein (TIGR00369 family)
MEYTSAMTLVTDKPAAHKQDPKPSKISAEEFEAGVRATIPMSEMFDFKVEHMSAGEAALRIVYNDKHVRAGGTVSGPIIMTLIDTALYAACLSLLGLELMAVTQNLNIHFLRKPGQADLIGRARIIKLGRHSAVGEVWVSSDGKDEPVAHATGTYAIPATSAART